MIQVVLYDVLGCIIQPNTSSCIITNHYIHIQLCINYNEWYELFMKAL